jgi:prepilin-type N-terminal cleavage/methylation domain-containing protein
VNQGLDRRASFTRARSGFTLIELLIVVVLIAGVLTIAAVSFGGYFQRVAAERAAQVFAQDLTAARAWATRSRRAVVIRFFESTLRYEVEEQATGTDIAQRRFGTNADIDLSAITLDFTGDIVVFDSRGVADLSGAAGALGTATFSSGAAKYTVSFNSMGASKIDRT